MGSRTVDFMNSVTGPPLFDHEIKNLVVRELGDIQDNFELYHDYAFNATSFHLCDIMADKVSDSHQVRSPGILLVAEVEGIKGDLKEKELEATILYSLKKENMTVKSSELAQTDDKTFIFVSMKEGYVITRYDPNEHYVGLDIHLWSSVDKQSRIMNAFVSDLGGVSLKVSSYRVITGGMFGVDGWTEDDKLHGPQFKELCDKIKGTTAAAVTNHLNIANETDVFTSIEQGLHLLGRNKLKIAILVGNSEGSGNFTNNHTSIVSEFKDVSGIVVLYCPSMATFNRYESGDEALTACENHLRDVIVNDSEIELFDAIIIDSTADKVTSSILLKVLFDGPLAEIMEVDSIVITSSVSKEEQAWKKNFMLRLKDEVFGHDPDAAFVDIAVTNRKADSEFNIMITNYGSEKFVHSLNKTIVEFNTIKMNDLFAKVNILNGGAWRYQEDFEPSRVFLPDDYDQTEPLAQWKSQKPLGHQAILQLEPSVSSGSATVEISEAMLREAIYGAVKEVEVIGWNAGSLNNYCDVGEGCLFFALFESGTLTVLWDGRSHIDINIFTLKEDIDLVDVFVERFLESIPTHGIMLRDEQPRGSSVAYHRDLSDGKLPHWAPIQIKE